MTERFAQPTFMWDEENECWIFRSGDIVVSVLDDGHLLVGGHDVTMTVFFDQISEERGIRFQDYNSRKEDREA